MNWERKIEAQIATIDRFPKYLPSGLHTSEITALLRPLLDVAVAADEIRCELKAEIERLQKRVSDADECIEEQEEMLEHLIVDQGQYEKEIERLRDALERLEAWVEQTNPDAYEKWKATQEALRNV